MPSQGGDVLLDARTTEPQVAGDGPLTQPLGEELGTRLLLRREAAPDGRDLLVTRLGCPRIIGQVR